MSGEELEAEGRDVTEAAEETAGAGAAGLEAQEAPGETAESEVEADPGPGDLEAADEAAAEAAEPPDRAVFDAFLADNPWFEDEPTMRGAALALAEQLHAEGLTEPQAQLAEVARRIRTEFAHRFENPRRRQAAAVEGAPGARRSVRGTYADLPPEARAACDRFVKQGLLTRDQFVKDYKWR